jgi:methionyl-tRNA formyltransferase
MGTPEFALLSLRKVYDKYGITAVVTAPDKQKGRGLTLQYSDVKKFALEKNLRVLQPESLKDEKFISDIKELNPDLIIVVAFRILPVEVFTIPKLGTFNLHASLLPKYRGAAPINRAIMNGEKETGVTTFFLQEKVDTGNIILQRKIAIKDEDDAGIIHDKLSEIGAETVLETIDLIEKGNINLTKQDDSSATKAPKIFKEDCQINWDSNATGIHNFIRGLSPYPAAYTHLAEKIIKIYKSKLTNLKSEELPGKIIIENKNLYVEANDFLLQITELQFEGKKKITAVDFINGFGKDKTLNFQ